MIAIISDVHGNYPALKAVLDEIDKLNVDSIISLGDLAGYYCYINECIDLCKKYNVLNIMGNHDYYLLSGTGCPRSVSANICLEHQMKTITQDNYLWLKNSISVLDNDLFSLRHGGWKDSLDEYIYHFSFNMIDGYNQKIFGSGHTHIQTIMQENGKIYFNPGSVGQPRDHDPRAAYAIIDDAGCVKLRRCEYAVNETINAMKTLGFQDRISICLRHGTKIGESL